MRFWHRAPTARAVAVAVSGWFRPVPSDACDLESAGDGWWTASFRVPDDWQAAYWMVEHQGDGAPPWHADGLHSGPRIVPGSAHLRDAALPRTVRVKSREWLPTDEPAAADLETLPPERDGDPRVRLWRAPASTADAPLVVFFDGEAHVDRLGTPAVISAAQSAGIMPDVAVAFVDAGPDRADVLGLPGGQSEWVATRLVPRLHGEGVLGGIRRDRTTVVGSSFGGLSALFALAHGRGTIHAAVAQSTSFWRFDAQALQDALTDEYRHSDVRVRLHAGRYEGRGSELSTALARRLSGIGVDASARTVTGGHDWTWWIPEAVEEIGALLRP